MRLPGKRQHKRLEGAKWRADHIRWTLDLVLQDEAQDNLPTPRTAEWELQHLHSALGHARALQDELEKTLAEEQARREREAVRAAKKGRG